MPKTKSNISRMPAFCGVDLGSTNTKVVLLAEDGTLVRRQCQPTPRADDLTVDANEILNCVETLIIAACENRLRVQAIAVAGIGEDGVLLDADLEPFGPALTWFDPRRIGLFKSIRPRLADLPGTGTTLDPARTLVGWAWAMGQANTSGTRNWVALTDYLAVRWTGTPFMSDTLAARTAAWNVPEQSWHDVNVKATLGRINLLPPVMRAGEVVGQIQSERLLASDVLEPNAVVVVGGHDHPIGAWGVSQLDSNAVLDSMGTAEVVVGQALNTDIVRPVGVDMAAGIKHPGRTLLSVIEIGRNVDWACKDPNVAYWIRQISAGLKEINPYCTSENFVPGKAGGGVPHYNNENELTPISKASAVLGALACLGKYSVDMVASQMPGPASIYAAGGWARAPGWITLKERYLQAPIVLVPETEVTAVSAAMLAAQAIGVTPDPEVCFSFSSSKNAVAHGFSYEN